MLYVADFLGGFPGFRVTLLSIVPEPEEDFFDTEAEKDAWTRQKMEEANKMLRELSADPDPVRVPRGQGAVRSCVNERKALSEAILQSQCGLSCCTVVVGRHHKSKSEEFLFGSTSSKIMHEAKNCAVWVVE